MDRTLSQREQLVLALAECEQRTKLAVPVERLTVQAFRMFPGSWALRGFPDAPNHNQTIALLSHRLGPVKSGLMERPLRGVAIVRLTEAGRKMAERLTNGVG